MRRARLFVTSLGVAALCCGGLVGCALYEPEDTLFERAQRKERKLAELKKEADRTAELEQAKREAEKIRAGLIEEIAMLEAEIESLRDEIERLRGEEAAFAAKARETGAAEDLAAAKALESRRLEHQRQIEEYQREIAGLKKLLRKSAEAD